MAKEHIFKNQPENKANWTGTESVYRRNGHAATLGDAGRCNRYKRPESIRATLQSRNNGEGWNPSKDLAPVEKLGPAHVARYYFDYVALYVAGKREGQAIANFSRGGTPYGNQAHHLIPQAQYLALFPTREAAMLKRIDYDVDNGRNIIFLPAHVPDTGFHNLPYHMGSHPQYDSQVKKDAKELAKNLKKLSEKACDEAKVAAIKDELLLYQEDYWKMLAKAGPISVNAVIFKKRKRTRS